MHKYERKRKRVNWKMSMNERECMWCVRKRGREREEDVESVHD